ncbi:MAG: hypothetical protein Q9190_006963, partial [Brigantiaea leucoxantha]
AGHARIIQDEASLFPTGMIIELYDTAAERFKHWFPIFWNALQPHSNQPVMNSIRLAALNRHSGILQRLLEANGSDLDVTDKEGNTALILGSEYGYADVVRVLLKEGADVNAQGGEYGNALQAASAEGHDQVVQILLSKGADINAQGGVCGNALQAASAGGHDQVVQILLSKGADVNAQGGEYGNALHAASWGGHDQVVQILLSKGADVNAQGGWYGNALQAASARGHDQVLQILLSKGADVNAQGGHHGNALQAASERGHDQVVQMLLSKGADINAQGGWFGNALRAASWGGHDQVVQMLLSKGADVNAQGGEYGNALQVASAGGHDQVLQILLSKGADVNAQGGHHGNALQAASERGHDKVVQMPLENSECSDLNGPHRNESSSLTSPNSIPSKSQAHSTLATSTNIEEDVENQKEIQSLISDKDDIGSQVSRQRTRQEMAALDCLGILLAENDALDPFYKEAFPKIGRARFVDNFRRLLKFCYLDLLPLATTNLEKATIKLLKDRQNRLRIALQIADVHVPENNETRTRTERQLAEAQDRTAYLEDWITNNAGFTSQSAPVEPKGSIHENPSSDSDREDSSEGHYEQDEDIYDLPRVTEMENFITEGKAFTNLLMNFQIFFLPMSLQPLVRIIMSIPSERVWFSSMEDTSIANRIKLFIEQITEDDWNWWPLRPKVRVLKEDQIRLHWSCVGNPCSEPKGEG